MVTLLSDGFDCFVLRVFRLFFRLSPLLHLFGKLLCSFLHLFLQLLFLLAKLYLQLFLAFCYGLFYSFEVVVAFLVVCVASQRNVLVIVDALVVNSAQCAHDEHCDVVPKLLFELVLQLHVFIKAEQDVFLIREAPKKIRPPTHE